MIIIIINVYIPPFSDFDNILCELDGILKNQQGTDVIMTGDFNAKNKIWGEILMTTGENN